MLTSADAEKHPDFARFEAAFRALPSQNLGEYETACYVRWLALSLTPAGGVMSDYDVLNVGWLAPQEMPVRLTTLMGFIPAAVIGSAAEYLRAAELFRDFAIPPTAALSFARKGKPHVSDQAILRHAIMHLHLFDQSRVAFGFKSERSEEAQLLHFSHLAVGRRGKGKSRNELMRAVLDSLPPLLSHREGHNRTHPASSSIAGAGAGGYPPVCAADPWPQEVPAALRRAVCGANITGRHCYDDHLGVRTCLPGFLGIGFERAATAKLFELLSAHPAVCVAGNPESRLLERVEEWPHLLRVALGNTLDVSEAAPRAGKAEECLHGELRPDYATPFRPKRAAATIASAGLLLPADTVFIAGVRDPVARAFSQYRAKLVTGDKCPLGARKAGAPCFTRTFPNATGTFRAAVCYAMHALGGDAFLTKLAASAEEGEYPFRPTSRQLQYPHWDLLSPGFYERMLRPWAAAFGPARLHVFEAERLGRKPGDVLRETVRALRLPPLDAARVVGNGTLFSRSSNSLVDKGGVGGGLWGGGGGGRRQPRMGDDKELLRFLRALYSASNARANEVYGTHLPVPRFAEADLASHRKLCARFALGET